MMEMLKFPRHRRFSGHNFIECGQNQEALCVGHKFMIVEKCDAGVS
jgi:hypothetical protein